MAWDPLTMGTWAQWASAAATTAGFVLGILALVRHYYVERVLEFDRRYKQHRDYIGTLWRCARNQYVEFRKQHTELPEELDQLIRRAGVPPNLPPVTRDIRDWRHANASKLTSLQQKMLAFASCIYPERKGQGGDWSDHSAITDKTAAEAFHKARGELAWFWDTEAWPVWRRHLRQHHADGRDLLILISWLEIALHEWTDTRGLGKVRLFKVLQRTWKEA